MEEDRYAADHIHNLSKTSKPLLVRHDLEGIAALITKDQLANRAIGMWRYREFLPVRKAKNILSLGEICTPLIECRQLAARLDPAIS